MTIDRQKDRQPMNKFLQQIASIYWKEVGPEIGEMCFVFPNRRSASFFRHYLGQAAGKAVFAPELVTINDFFGELSGLESIDKISALYRLYRHYSALMWPDGAPKESFDKFVFWGDILLSDFDDIDKYMADARLLFANIKDINEIGGDYKAYLSERQIEAIREFWRNFLSSGPDSPKIQSFRTTWSILYQLYTDFRSELESEGLGYEGMIYRRVADIIKRDVDMVKRVCLQENHATLGPVRGGTACGGVRSEARTFSAGKPALPDDSRETIVEALKKYKRIVFVGLNALNECEKALLNLIRDSLDGDFYWDFEDKRTRDEANKSSFFLRENIIRYPSKYSLQPSLPATQTFRTFAVPSSTGQTRVAHELLRELASQEGFDPMETAIVLPEEKLLMPMLGAVPEEITSINVTMGYPLSASNAATFITFLERLHRNRRNTSRGACAFYHRDVVNLLNHPYLSTETQSSETIAEIVKGNIIYPEATYLSGKNELWAKTFVAIDSTDAAYQYLLELIDAICGKINGVELEFLFHLRKAVQRMQSLHIEMKLDTCFDLIEQLVSTVSVPFEGEPLHGLQIMGPLETRALDFKNIIILSMTEGVFPKRSVSSSFIPYNIRLGFGLPNYEFQDALSSYYFYRSIARAENVRFIYDSTTGGMQSGEESRFLKQLKYHFNVPLNLQAVSFPLEVDAEPTQNFPEVEKSPEILRRLREKFVEGEKPKPFSASSLNSYIDCPMSFYFRYVEGIDESDEVVEGLDSGLFGSIFHKTMELLYNPYVGQTLSADTIASIAADKEKIAAAVATAFREEGKIDEVTGRNIIVRELIFRYVDAVLAMDAANAPIQLIGTEKGMDASLTLDDDTTVKIFGIIDRMERRSDGKLYIIDYKTGKVNKKNEFKQVAEIFSPSDERPSIALQMLMYVYLAVYRKQAVSSDECMTVIYALREIFKDNIKDNKKDNKAVLPEELDLWLDSLKKLISEIFNPDVPFTVCENERKCEWCSYKTLCGR